MKHIINSQDVCKDCGLPKQFMTSYPECATPNHQPTNALKNEQENKMKYETYWNTLGDIYGQNKIKYSNGSVSLVGDTMHVIYEVCVVNISETDLYEKMWNTMRKQHFDEQIWRNKAIHKATLGTVMDNIVQLVDSSNTIPMNN